MLYTLDSGKVTSKKAALVWASTREPRWRPLFQQVLKDRALGFDADTAPRPGSVRTTLAFADYARDLAQE